MFKLHTDAIVFAIHYHIMEKTPKNSQLNAVKQLACNSAAFLSKNLILLFQNVNYLR